MDIDESVRVQPGLNRWGTVVRASCTDDDVRHAARDLGLFGLPYGGAIGQMAAYL